jgi:mannose-1-phosphate guanylyltransferase/mannose-6-phosphate isomerase
MITPVLLCGGSGTRLWPLSRKSYPKQFTSLVGDRTLFQQSARRLSGEDYAEPVVVTNAEFRFIVADQLAAEGIEAGAILIEPEGRNTAPAILAAALHLQASDPDALMLVAPADHVIPDAEAFRATVGSALEAARQGRLVTFGIQPTRPETGYGYIEVGKRADGEGVHAVTRFVEKPAAARAEEILAAGGFLWNAGIFLFSARAIVEAFARHAPGLEAPVRAALDGARLDLGFTRLDPQAWSQAPSISIDYAVMEKADTLSVVAFSGAWSDLGDWEAIWRETPPDGQGLSISGPVTAIDCRDSLLRSEDDGLELVGIGLTDIVAVAMPDAVLIADRSRVQEVKQAVDALKAKKVRQAEAFARDHRPWGWFESLAVGERFQVKRIVVKPGGTLSLQSHHHRAEHWVVVSGTARVTIGDTARLVTENESVYVPLGARHRLENPGKVEIVLIEVQTGAYLGEDDIVRHEDIYARDPK